MESRDVSSTVSKDHNNHFNDILSLVTGVTALCPWARHIYSSLVLVQPRNTRPYVDGT